MAIITDFMHFISWFFLFPSFILVKDGLFACDNHSKWPALLESFLCSNDEFYKSSCLTVFLFAFVFLATPAVNLQCAFLQLFEWIH